MANSIKGNILYNVLLNVSGVLFPLITAPYISRVIEPDGLGLFNFSNTYAYYFACFAALGIPYYGTREIAKVRDSIEKQADFVSEVITISCMSTVLVCAFFFLSLLFVPQINENYLIFLISGVFLYITPFRIDWFFRGREEFRYITSRSLIIKTVSIILLFVFVRQKSDLIIYVILNVFSLTANEIWNYIKLLKLGIRPRIKFSGMKHIKPLVVLFLSTIAWSVYAFLDTIMLGFMTSYDEVGYYSSAVHIARALVPVVTSVAAVTMPRIANYSGSNNWGQISELFDKTFSLVSFVSFPIAFGVVTVAPTFVPLFFGSQFEGTILPLQIVIGVVVAIGFSNLTALQILIGLGYDKLYLYSVLVGTSLNFVINLLLIPYYGASGAAIASVIAEFSVFLVSLYYVYTKTDIRINNFKEMCYSFLCSFTFIPIGIFLYSYTSGWIYVVAFGVVASSLYLLEQWCLKNPSILLLYNVIRSKLSK